uniref:Putative secreted peptide of 4.3 kDa n=1 Tax=Ixodes ricinus TaxID=34613 RepID=V5GQH1_IXORI
MLKMAQKLTLIMFVVFGLLAISTFDYACGRRDQGNAQRPDCTMTPCTDDSPCRSSPCTKCSNGWWGTKMCTY